MHLAHLQKKRNTYRITGITEHLELSLPEDSSRGLAIILRLKSQIHSDMDLGLLHSPCSDMGMQVVIHEYMINIDVKVTDNFVVLELVMCNVGLM